MPATAAAVPRQQHHPSPPWPSPRAAAAARHPSTHTWWCQTLQRQPRLLGAQQVCSTALGSTLNTVAQYSTLMGRPCAVTVMIGPFLLSWQTDLRFCHQVSCVNCRHRRHNCIVCPLPPHQLNNWSVVRRTTFNTPHSPVLQAALCLAPLLSASAPPLTPFAAATAAAATTADLLSSVTPPPLPCRPDPAWLCCRALQHHPEAAGWRQPWPHPLPHQGQGPRGSSSSRSYCCRHRRRQCCQQGTQPQEGDGSGSSTQVRPLQLSSPCV